MRAYDYLTGGGEIFNPNHKLLTRLPSMEYQFKEKLWREPDIKIGSRNLIP